MGWISVPLAVACLAVGLLHLLRCVLLRLDPVGEASHAAMGFGMAAMFVPGDPVPVAFWTVVFVLCGSWFGAQALRARNPGGDAGHHVIGSATMLFMLAAGHSHAPGSGGSGHAGHLAHGGGSPGAASIVAIVLAGYFAWHVLRCADGVGASSAAERAAAGAGAAGAGAAGAGAADPAPTGALAVRGTGRRLLSARTAAQGHVVMAGAMTVMLLAMI